MAAGGPSPAGDSKSLATVLVPVAGVALIVVLVVVIGATNEPGASSTDKGGGGSGKSSLVSGPGKPMSDGSDGGTEDADLKTIGDGGLKYRDLKAGTGPECPKGVTVKAHYAGWLANGTEFDASRKHGSDPLEFSLNGVVAGWTEGIPGMKVGGIRKLVIPASMGYGARGQGKIPGGATLIFEVELVAIN
ncbi:MAG: FKBP-type peptidyl-prolyl cis-trans isomerase [Gemmataceae bacterium]